MKAARFYGPGQPLKVEDVPVPEVGCSDVLIKVKACGVCYSDVHKLHGSVILEHTPITLGHEVSGEIVEIGTDVKGFGKGDRVAVCCMVPCGSCHLCLTGRENVCARGEVTIGMQLDGGLAEYTLAPAGNVFKIPDTISYEEAAILTDALATPYHAIRLLCIKPGDWVVIYGMGGLGMCAVQVANVNGARVIGVDLFDQKLKIAKELGAEYTINATKDDPVRRTIELTEGGADIAMEFIGLAKTVEQAIKSVKSAGKVMLVGIGKGVFNVDWQDILFKQLSVFGCYGVVRADFPKLIELVSTGRINLKRLITHIVPLTEANKAIEILDKKIGDPIRVVVKP